MSQYKLVVDDREQAILPYLQVYLPDGKFEIEIKRIHIGDYAIYYESHLLYVIERKTWKDLSASLKDGRKENVKKLIMAREETKCEILYLIEGDARHPPKREFAHIPYKNLQAHLDHLIVRDRITIIYSTGPKDTADRLIEFTGNLINIASSIPRLVEIQSKVKAGAEQILDITRKISKTDLDITYAIWNAVPGITDFVATALLSQGYHISSLILQEIPREEISTIRYPSGMCIGSRAQKIIAVANDTPHNRIIYAKMIACINGITKKTAAIIIKEVGFHAILKGDIELSQLAQIKKSEKSKVGKKMAADILKFFVKPLEAT